MRKSIVFLSLIVSVLLLTSYANALDNPHDVSNSISCYSCHIPYGSAPTWYTQDPDPTNPDTKYPLNRLCWRCHGGVASYKKTHSNFAMYEVEDWTRECRTCHNPHGNRQVTRWGSASYLFSGPSALVGTNTIKKSGAANWGPGDWEGKVVIGNISLPGFNYRIVSNTADTLTVQGTINTRYVKAGNTFAIVYGRLVKDYISSKNVKFFTSENNKPNNLADGDAVIDGICEVCHTKTTYYKNDGTGAPHNLGSNCTTSCHSHLYGFKGAGCNVCHGYPPPDLATPATGSGTPGAHVLHATTKGYQCAICHFNSVGSETTHNNNIITLGFVNILGAYTGGSYDGQTSANYESSHVSTTVSEGDSKKCSSIYCHSNVQPNGGTGSPSVYATPAWDNVAPNNVVCGSCHKGRKTDATTMDSGSHTKHLSYASIDCAKCHNNAGSGTTPHVNNNINISFASGFGGSYPSPNTPGNGYGNCSNVYCHSSGQSLNGQSATPVYQTATWGGTVVCGNCHKTKAGDPLGAIDTGSHTKHIASSGVGCNDCHTNAAEGGTEYISANHVNKLIDVETGVSYTKGGTPGNGYGTCSTASCHTNVQSDGGGAGSTVVTPQWGTPTACGECHKGRKTDATTMDTGSHTKHLSYTSIDCANCHNSAPHTDGNIDVLFSSFSGGSYSQMPSPNNPPENGYGTCSNVYCHSSGQAADGGAGGPVYQTATWDGTVACGDCHKTTAGTTLGAIDTGSHTKHIASSGVGCNDCHTGAVAGGTSYNSANHINKLINVEAGLTYSLDGTPGNNYGTCSTASCHSNGKGVYKETPIWGGTLVGDCTDCHGFPPATNAHAAHIQDATLLTKEYGNTEVVSNVANYDFGCGNCHPTNEATYHGNSSVDIRLNPTDGGTLKSLNDLTAAPSGASPAIVCNKVYCHSNGAGGAKSNLSTAFSPAWNTTFGANKCDTCHDNPPQYASAGAGLAGANSHYNETGFMGEEGGHMLTIHRDNIYDKVAGNGRITLDDAVSTDSRHGNPAVATTMACYVCHSGVVSSTTIDTYAMNGTGSSFECGACHTGATPTKLQAGVIDDKSLHVNGSPNVAFANITVKSKAQLRNSSLPAGWARNGTYGVSGSYDSSTATLNTGSWASGDKTCTVVCHNSQPVQWGDTGATCYSCHKDLP